MTALHSKAVLRRLLGRSCALWLAATLLAGCGLKGDLYLEEDLPQDAVADSGAEPGATGTTDDADDDDPDRDSLRENTDVTPLPQ